VDWKLPETPLSFVTKLITAIDRLHEAGHGHGDLKPDNIVVDENGDVALIDFIDFSPKADGEKQTSAYAPAAGTVFERDRFAVTKIAEETFANVEFEAEHAARIAKSIVDCREKEPKLTTLLPLKDAITAIQASLAGPAETQADAVTLSLSIRNAAVGPLQSDEGFFYLRAYPASSEGPATLHVRGAAEEIETRFDDKGNPSGAWRRQLGQTRISIVARHEFLRLPGNVEIARSDQNNIDDVEDLLAIPAVHARLPDAFAGRIGVEPPDEEARAPDIADEGAEEALTEEIAAASARADVDLKIDVPYLWRTLIDTEKELTTEGVADSGSSYDRTTRRHRVPFDLQSGSFDFDRNDTVGVQRQDKRGSWKRIGELDNRRSRSGLLMIDATSFGSSPHFQLVDAGQRPRFVSHFETESLRRRADAVGRILGGSRREANLSAVFDPRSNSRPTLLDHSVESDELKSAYGLNDDQCAAFKRIVAARPVGLLQGPPGTGKTKFIAALAHYAITKKLARNVLLSSQSHEAVNTAGEALLSLFRKTGGEPSILRVAMSDDQVSDMIRPFHTRPVEQAFKDRFAAEFRQRQLIIGSELGISDEVVDEIVDLEMTIRPIAVLTSRLETEEPTQSERLAGLKQSLATHLQRLQLEPGLADEVGAQPEAFVDMVSDRLVAKLGNSDAPSADKLARLRGTIRLGQDFIGSASRIQRSFETFLAGTRQIVLGTCVGLGRTSLGLTSTAFDLVIVDEAARCTASELLVPLQAARWAVLVGDQAQLEPHHEATVVNRVSTITSIPKKEVQRSDFERVFLTEYADAAGARLKTQYRMLPPIGQLVSEAFYPNLSLQPGRPDPIIPANVLPDELSHPLTWVATDELGEAAYDRKKEEGGSRTSKVEVDAIVAMLTSWYAQAPFRTWMTEQTDAPIAVGVICTYGAQRDLMHQHLLRSPIGHLLGKHVKVGTVDSYQGKENPIVILSLVRHNRDGAWEEGAKTIKEGFLASPNRINVAASRAMDRLLIVGAHRRWRTDSPLGHVVAAFGRRVDDGSARVIEVEEVLGQKVANEGALKKRKVGPQSAKEGKA
jgi:AAA domain